MQQADIFGLIKWQFHEQFTKERLLMSGFALAAITGTFLPVLNPRQDRLSKAIELGYGFSSSIAFTTAAWVRQTKERIYASIDKSGLEITKTTLKGRLVVANSVEEIAAKRDLLEHIKKLPESEQYYWASAYGLQGLLSPPIEVEAREEGRLALPAAQSEFVKHSPLEPQIDWLHKLVGEMALEPEKRKHHHLCINGGSQSGKSTLFSCILALLSQAIAKLNANSKIIINLIDPKYPKTRWSITPSFIGFEQVGDGIENAVGELEDRKLRCIEAEKNGLTHPDFDRYILVLDEWDSIWGEGKGYGKSISKQDAAKIRGSVLRILKESAAYNMTLVVIGQSPLSKTSGFSRSDLNSATRVVLGNEALKWTQDPGFPFNAIVSDLQEKLNYWIKKEARCALVCPNIGQPFVEAIPRFDEAKESTNSGNEDWLERINDWISSLEEIPTKEEVNEFYYSLMGERLNAAQLKELMNYLEIVEES